MIIKHILVLFLVLALMNCAAASDAPNVTLASPNDGVVYTTSNITFVCNATDDENVFNISLYTNINGDFIPHETKRVMELEEDSDTLLLCHFNNYDCEAGEIGDSSGTGIVQSIFMNGVMVNDSDTLRYQTSGNLNFTQGTLEFWVKLGVDPSSNEFWFFSTGEQAVDEIHMYNDFGDLYFEYFDDSGLATAVFANISSWNQDEWHHIAGAWDLENGVGNGEAVDLFMDGSNSSTSIDSMDFGSLGTPGQYLYIGSLADGTEQANSVFDELRISDIPRTESEINASYVKGVGNHSNENANWTITGIDDGTYIWNCYAVDNESNGAWNDTNFTFHVDVSSPPDFNSIAHSPSDENELDPGVTVNITANITDPSNVSAAMLQHMTDSVPIWTNMSMNNISDDEWNASFVAGYDDIWYYRVWTNDTLGHAAYSSTHNISVDYDYTWFADKNDLGTTYAYIGTEKTLGVVTISNTGDYPLGFNISSTYSNTEYNVSDPLGFDVPVGSNTSIEVNATAAMIAYEYQIDLTLDAMSGNADPSLEMMNATLISYVGGPHLSVEITEAPTSVLQSQSGVNLTTRAKNIGNETATGVWLIFSLPAGFSNISGNASQYIGSLAQGASQDITIAVSVSPTQASAGASLLYANASCFGGVNGSDSLVVGISCNSDDGVCGLGCSPSTDDDCESGGGGGDDGGTTFISGGAAIREYELALDAPSRIDINRGENRSFPVTINYDLTFTADGIAPELSGYPLTYLSVYPERFDGVNDGDSIGFDVTVVAPPYIKAGQYMLGVELSGRGRNVNKTLSGSAGILLFVHSAGNESDLFEQAREAAQGMIDAGFSGDEFRGMVERLDSLVEDWDYDAAQGLAGEMISTSGLAFKVKSMLEGIGPGLEDARTYGLAVTESEKLYGLAMTAFQRGDYGRAEERANNAMLSFSMETYGMLPLLMLAHAYWWLIAGLGFGFGVGTLALRRRAAIEILKRKITELEFEGRAIEGLIIRLQRDYFGEEPRIGKASYSKAMQEYESRLAEIRRIRARLKARTGTRGLVNMLKRERDDIIGFMKEAQARHFERGDMSRGLYRATMTKMREELGDVEKGIDMLSRKGKKGSLGVMFLSLVFVMMAASAAAQHDSDAALQEIEGAGQAISDMLGAGFGTSYANDTLNEAGIMLSRGEYAAAGALAREVWGIRDAALEADMLIDQAEERIYAASMEGINTSRASELFLQGAALFDSENYMESRDMLGGAIELVETLQSEAALKESLGASPGEQVMLVLREYWQVIVLVLMSAVLAVMFVRKRRRISALKGRLGLMEREKASIGRLMAETQNRYFRLNSMGKLDYETVMERYSKRIVRVERDMFSLRQATRHTPGKHVRKDGAASPAAHSGKEDGAVKKPDGVVTRGPGPEMDGVNSMIDRAEDSIKKGELDTAAKRYREVLSVYKKLSREGSPQRATAVYGRMKRLYSRLRDNLNRA